MLLYNNSVQRNERIDYMAKNDIGLIYYKLSEEIPFLYQNNVMFYFLGKIVDCRKFVFYLKMNQLIDDESHLELSTYKELNKICSYIKSIYNSTYNNKEDENLIWKYWVAKYINDSKVVKKRFFDFLYDNRIDNYYPDNLVLNKKLYDFKIS